MSEELKMYVEYRDGKPHGYLYGPSWKAWELLMEGGYPTPEEAKAAWEAEQDRKTVVCLNCGKRVNPRMSERQMKVEVRGVKFTYPEEFAWCPDCCQEVHDPVVDDINAARRKRYYAAHKKLEGQNG